LPVSPGKGVEDGKPVASRTPMKFYDTLTKDEAAAQTDVKPPEQPDTLACDTKPDGQKEDPKQGRTPRTSEAGAQQSRVSVPEAETKTRTYTVQVGAFSQPAIAQEWAQKWKARGYDPVLKPVARPKTGVIYRLYLGKFTSEKKADDLVSHLKSKEGINALRLLVRD
jgi:cell division septation protein DedD